MAHASKPTVSQLRHVDEYVADDTFEDYIDGNYTESQFRHVDEYRDAKEHLESEA